MAAIAAAESGADTILVSDGPVGRSNSVMAQGGLQVPRDGQASRDAMVSDMERSARAPLDHERVRRFVGEILPTVRLLEEWGLILDRDDGGALIRRSAGGLSEPRIVSAGDRIGGSLIKVLRARLTSLPIEVMTGHQVIGVGSDGDRVVVDTRGEVEQTLRPGVVVAATGGMARRFAEQAGERTTNPPNGNHSVIALLSDLGVPVLHPEWFQYQPFGLVDVVGGSADRCIPESIVNLPVRLLDRLGDPVARPGDDRLDVTRAIATAVRSGRSLDGEHGVGVRMTLGDLDPDEVSARFPGIWRVLEAHGLAGRDVLVRPFLHYWLGGLEADVDGSTRVPGLLLAGEMVGGLHGRNRLMGAGITDALVNGRIAGVTAADR